MAEIRNMGDVRDEKEATSERHETGRQMEGVEKGIEKERNRERVRETDNKYQGELRVSPRVSCTGR